MNKEQILALIKEKETEARNKDISQEKRAQLLDEIKSLKTQLDSMPEANYRGMDVFNTENKENKNSFYATREYRNAWFESVRQGNDSYVRRFISTNDSGDSTGGNVVIPTMLADTIETAIRNGGSIISLCNITDYAGFYSVPYEKNSGEDADEREEGGEASAEGEIELGEATLKPSTIVKWIKITKEMEVMAIDAFADYVTEILKDKILKKCDAGVVSGEKADKGLNGIINVGNTAIVPEIESALDFGTGFKAQGELDDKVEAICIMNKKTFFNNIMQQKDTTGRPIFTSMIDPTTGKAVYYYNGMLIKFENTLPEYDTASSSQAYMIVGDMKGYHANFPNGFAASLLRDPYSLSEKGQIKYIADIMAGGNVTKIKHLCVVKKPAA